MFSNHSQNQSNKYGSARGGAIMDDSSNVSALSKAIHEIHLSHMDPIAREHAKIPSSSTQGRRAQGKNDKS